MFYVVIFFYPECSARTLPADIDSNLLQTLSPTTHYVMSLSEASVEPKKVQIDEQKGLKSDARLCTRRSMPTLFKNCTSLCEIGKPEQERVHRLMTHVSEIKRRQCLGEQISSKDDEAYSQGIAELAYLIQKHVRPNAPHETRKLFSMSDPPAQWLARAKATCCQNFAWLDERAIEKACHRHIDVSPNSNAPAL